MITKTITIAEVVIPATTVEVKPVDLTIFLENGETSGIRMSLSNGQRIEIKKGDPRWSDARNTTIESLCQSILDEQSDEEIVIEKKAVDSVMVEAKQKAFDKAVADGIITADGFPVEPLITK